MAETVTAPNLFSGSLVAVNAATGKYLWHFQLVHHDIWDHDMDTPPVLLTVRRDGKDIPAVATMTKSAYLFILDRVTGKPLYEVKEEPVPASTVTGEQAWPTQPIPAKPPALARQSFTAAKDIATVTPEHKAFCEKLIKDKKLHDSVRYSPLTMDSRIARFPGSGGGPEWAGGAMDEKRGLFIINTHDMGSIEMVEQKKEGHWGSADGPDSFFIDEKNKLMCQEPPWGTLLCHQRQHRRHCLEHAPGRDRQPAGRVTQHRPAQHRRADGDGGRAHLHCRHR